VINCTNKQAYVHEKMFLLSHQASKRTNRSAFKKFFLSSLHLRHQISQVLGKKLKSGGLLIRQGLKLSSCKY